MKSQAVALWVLVIVMVSGISTAVAAPYVSGNAGMVWAENSGYRYSEYKSDLHFTQIYKENGDLSYDEGYGFTLAAGNDFGNGVRAEVELGYKRNDTDEIDGSYSKFIGTFYRGRLEEGDFTRSVDGNVTSISLMVNAFYDFMPTNAVSPFVGAGIGVANVEPDVKHSGNGDDNVFAYQLAVGVAFTISQNSKLDLQYRYFTTDDPDIDGIVAEYATHNLMVGMRYNF